MSSIHGEKEVSKVSSESDNFIVHFKVRGRWPKGGKIHGLLCVRPVARVQKIWFSLHLLGRSTL